MIASARKPRGLGISGLSVRPENMNMSSRRLMVYVCWVALRLCCFFRMIVAPIRSINRAEERSVLFIAYV